MIDESRPPQSENGSLLLIGSKIGEGRENEVFEYGSNKVIKLPKLEKLNSQEYLESMREVYAILKSVLEDCLPDIDFKRIKRQGKDCNAAIQRKVTGKSIASIFREMPQDNDYIATFLENETQREKFMDLFQKIRLASLRIGVPLDMGQDNIYLEESGNISLIDIGGIPVIKEILENNGEEFADLKKVVAESILETLEEFQRWEQGLIEKKVDMAELNRKYGIDEEDFKRFVEDMEKKASSIVKN